MTRRPRTRVAVVLIEGDKILLVQHRKGDQRYWLLPGGGLDFGESIHACARREIAEETGLQIDVVQFLYLSESIAPDASRHILNIYVLGRVLGGTINVPENDIIGEVTWIDMSRLPEITLYPAIAPELLTSHQTNFNHEMRYIESEWVDAHTT